MNPIKDLNLNKLQNNFHIVLRRFFKTPVTNPNQYELIINLYHQLQTVGSGIEKFQTKPQKVFIKTHFDIEKFKSYGWQYLVINFLKEEVNKKLSDFIIVFLIHGSFATKDFLPDWSDLDTLIILNNKVFENVENLKYVYKTIRKMALLCYKIDPLAHHEFEFITEFNLRYYPRYMFPTVLYDYSVLLSGKSEFDIIFRPDKSEEIKYLEDFLGYFWKKIDVGDFSRNKFFWKNDLSQMMLWPSLLLQAKNIFIYKKYSFDRAKEEFKNLDFSPVDRATAIRNNWKTLNLLKYYPSRLLSILPYWFNEKVFYLFRKISRSSQPKEPAEKIKELTLKFYSLAKSSLEYILNNKNGIL